MTWSAFIRFSVSLIVGSVAFLTGCDEPPDPDRQAVIDTLESGVVSVRNSGDTVHAQTWHLEHISRVGSIMGDDADVFGSIGALTVDAFGRIWVYDQHAKELRVFDRDGSHVRTVGRAGQGPGEFNEVVGLLWSPEGHLWTVDQRAARVSIFDSAGTFLTSRPFGGTSFYARWPGIVDQHGYFYNIERDFTSGRTVLTRLDSLFRAVDSLAVPSHPNGSGSVLVAGPRIGVHFHSLCRFRSVGHDARRRPLGCTH